MKAFLFDTWTSFSHFLKLYWPIFTCVSVLPVFLYRLIFLSQKNICLKSCMSISCIQIEQNLVAYARVMFFIILNTQIVDTGDYESTDFCRASSQRRCLYFIFNRVNKYLAYRLAIFHVYHLVRTTFDQCCLATHYVLCYTVCRSALVVRKCFLGRCVVGKYT